MTLYEAIFFLFSGLAVLSSLMVITQHNPVKSVLFLVFTFFSMSVLWLLAEAEFLSLILVLVYVGAVMTLFLFVVMMLNIDTEIRKPHFNRYLPFGLVSVALLVGLLLVALPSRFKTNAIETTNALVSAEQVSVAPSPSESTAMDSNTAQLGLALFTDYVYPFEVAAVILLVAIVSAITLTHRTRRSAKRQSVLQQLLVQKSDRLTIVKVANKEKTS
jgi:NADH-quinone oxidoreductase subunit J